MADVPTQECNECGSEDWTEFFERNREDPSDVVETRFECNECGAEARVFEENGTLIHSGAMR